ncbi:MAG: ABC transporter ATP-binding protein [Acidimicrobiales bacterium]
MTALLACGEVTRRFAGMTAVNRVSLSVEEGELLAIIGPNGAGKTTLFNLLSGQLRPNSGDVYFRDRCITDMPVHKRVGIGVGRTFQVVRPLPDLTVLENTMMGSFARHRRRGAAEKHAMEVIDEVGLGDVADARAGDLPLPKRKRLEVARALATEPSVLLLDEVMSGLNPTEISQAVELFRRLHSKGLSVVLIEHNLKVVRSLSHRVVVLDHGVVIATGTPEEVLEHPDVVRAYLGNRR